MSIVGAVPVNNLGRLGAILVDSLPLDILWLFGEVLVGLHVVLARQAVEELRVLPAQQAEQVLKSLFSDFQAISENIRGTKIISQAETENADQ